MTENQSESENRDSNERDDDSVLNLDEGVGQFDETNAEEEQFTTADPGWGAKSSNESDDSPNDSNDFTASARQSDQQGSSDAISGDDTQTSSDNTINGTSVYELLLQAEDQSLSFNLENEFVPGTDYDGLKYVYKRMGKKKTEYDRPKKLRLNVFEETGGQIEVVQKWFEEEVYPNVNVLKADVLEAALLAGIYNPPQMKAIMDVWGYAEMNES